MYQMYPSHRSHSVSSGPTLRRGDPVLRKAAVLAVLGAALATSSQGAIILDLPDLILEADTPDQSFVISVHNDGAPIAVNGVQLLLSSAGGGPGLGGVVGPRFSPPPGGSVVAEGLLFGPPNNVGQNSQTISDQAIQIGTSTPGVSTIVLGTLPPDGPGTPLATVTFDTTGVTPGIYSFSVTDLDVESSYFTIVTGGDPRVFPQASGGTLTVVPEPAHYAAGIGGALLALGIWRRVRR